MNLINNQNLDRCLLVTSKSENHRGFIELLYESKKRTGGDEISYLVHDSVLKQFLIIFKNDDTSGDVLANGDVNFECELYQAFRIDSTKLMIENIDSNLKNDVINLYVEYLVEETENSQFKLHQIKPGYVLVECSRPINFDSLAKKYSKHSTLQNKTIKLHLVPELDKGQTLNRVDMVRYFSNILNSCSELRCIASDNQYAENNPVQENCSANEIFYKEKIKNLEHKLLLYKNLNQSLNEINFFDDQSPNDLNNNAADSANDNCMLRRSCLKEANLVTREPKIFFQDNNLDSEQTKKKCDKSKLIQSFQKYLVDEEYKANEEIDKKSEPGSTTKICDRTILKKPQCSFFALRSKCSSLAQRFPIIKYQRPKCKSYFQPEEETGENSDLDTCLNLNIKCSICLEDLLPNENVKILSCFHQFHVKCIDTWLVQKSTCPTCKLDLINNNSNE